MSEDVSATAAAVSNFVNSSSNQDNKWSKNGFGEPCASQGGKFSKEESETVRRAVEEYCALKGITTQRLCSECDHKAELKGAWMEISKQLPHRTVQSVYRHGLRQLHPFKRGPWTEAECQQLAEHVSRAGKKWSSIQAKLNRSADSCRDKYREMNTEYVKGRWKENETELLKRIIREHLRADPNADIKELGKMVENEGIIIPWSNISKRMGKRSRLSCFKKWQKMTGLYSPCDQTKLPADGKTIPGPSADAVAAIEGALKVEDGTAGVSTEAHNAPTAGAAAAAMAAATQVVNLTTAPTTPEDIDLHILSAVANSNASREMDWSVFVGGEISDPQGRWNTMVDEWQDEDSEAGELLTKLRMCEVAQILLERKQQQQGAAKMAAETVEAVDLPDVKQV